jgi:hypothetical protein
MTTPLSASRRGRRGSTGLCARLQSAMAAGFRGAHVAEEPQQVVQQAVKAADEVQKELHEVSPPPSGSPTPPEGRAGTSPGGGGAETSPFCCNEGSKPASCPGLGVAYGHESCRSGAWAIAERPMMLPALRKSGASCIEPERAAD